MSSADLAETDEPQFGFSFEADPRVVETTDEYSEVVGIVRDDLSPKWDENPYTPNAFPNITGKIWSNDPRAQRWWGEFVKLGGPTQSGYFWLTDTYPPNLPQGFAPGITTVFPLPQTGTTRKTASTSLHLTPVRIEPYREHSEVALEFQPAMDGSDPPPTFEVYNDHTRNFDRKDRSPLWNVLGAALDWTSETAEAWEIIRDGAGIKKNVSNKDAFLWLYNGGWNTLTQSQMAQIAQGLATNIILDMIIGPLLGGMNTSIRTNLGQSTTHMPVVF